MQGRFFPRIARHALTLSATVVLLIAGFAGCGGGSSSSSSGGGNPPPPSVGGGAVTTPTVITLSAGQSASGANIVVPAAAASPAPNAMDLGVTTGTQGSADNTGAIVPVGFVGTVLMFGQGLGGNMQISISGPQDISISNEQS